ncbi:MAG: winged helix-turn-helix domain-containing protein [Xanthomonadales bacterium]
MSNTDKKIENWTFFSNNAHVLVCLTQAPQPTTREMAISVGITERAVQRIVKKMVEAGVLKVGKDGRRNRYELDLDQRLRHPLESHKTIGEFLQLMNSGNSKTGVRLIEPDPHS